MWLDPKSPGGPWYGAERTIVNVAVTFEPRENQTEVTLRHSGVPDDELGRQHQDGWRWILSMLAERFVSRPPASTTV